MPVIMLREIAAEAALQTVESRYGRARLLYTSAVQFPLGQDLVNGKVHVFQLADGRVASAWRADDASGPQVHAVIHTGGIATPIDALRSVHLRQAYEVSSVRTGGEQ
jgi:hypothetical protein